MPDKKKKTVKQWPEDERPRERLIAYGASTLSDASSWPSSSRTAGPDGRPWTWPWSS